MGVDRIGAAFLDAWREVMQAEEARGSATAGAQAAYEEALKRFRHAQIEVITVTLGEVALLREENAELKAQIAELKARIGPPT